MTEAMTKMKTTKTTTMFSYDALAIVVDDDNSTTTTPPERDSHSNQVKRNFLKQFTGYCRSDDVDATLRTPSAGCRTAETFSKAEAGLDYRSIRSTRMTIAIRAMSTDGRVDALSTASCSDLPELRLCR